MEKSLKTNITEAVQEILKRRAEAGSETTTADIKADFASRYPDLLLNCGRDLALNQIGTLGGEALRAATIGQDQFTLPGCETSALPVWVSISNHKWLPLLKITVRQYGEHVRMMGDQANAVKDSAKRSRKFNRFLRKHAPDLDMPAAEVLSIAAKEDAEMVSNLLADCFGEPPAAMTAGGGGASV